MHITRDAAAHTDAVDRTSEPARRVALGLDKAPKPHASALEMQLEDERGQKHRVRSDSYCRGASR